MSDYITIFNQIAAIWAISYVILDPYFEIIIPKQPGYRPKIRSRGIT